MIQSDSMSKNLKYFNQRRRISPSAFLKQTSNLKRFRYPILSNSIPVKNIEVFTENENKNWIPESS